MRRKRALVYVVAGLICASLATAVAFKYVSNASAGPAPTDRIQTLLATRDVAQGEVLVLTGADDNANAAFVAWPRDMVPDGAIHDKKDVTERRLRARTAFVKHEVIQKSRLVSEDDYVPSDMYLQILKVSEEDLESGRLRLGMMVDVLQVNGRRPVEFMRCAEISVVGRLDGRGLPLMEKDPPPNVWLLVKKADRAAFVEAQYSTKLLVVESTDPQCTEPYLVNSGDTVQERQEEAEALLARAKSLTQAGQYEQALSILDDLVNNFSDISTVANRVAVEQSKTRESLAQSLYERARAALEHEQNFSEALGLLDQLDKEAPATSSVREKARALRVQADAALEQHRLRVRYEALLSDVQSALAGGNLPKARESLNEMKNFSRQDVRFGDVPLEPTAAVEEYGRQLKSKTGDFNIMKQALDLFLKRHDMQAVQNKLADIKKAFPAHPEIDTLEQAVKATEPSE